MPHVIDKTLEFCYGHRVWTQVLDGRYAADLKCACRHLHGHEAKVQIYLTSDALNAQGMVTDFRHLETVKKWVNANLDHQFIVDRNDPLYPILFKTARVEETAFYLGTVCAGSRLVYPPDAPAHMQELFEGVTVVDFPPTSENLSSWFAKLVNAYVAPLNVRVSHVDWWETPKSRSRYVL